MALLKARTASLVAMLLFWLAIKIIRVTQHLYNRRLLSYAATERCFRAAKRLEGQGDRLVAGMEFRARADRNESPVDRGQ